MNWQPKRLSISCKQNIALSAGLGSSASAVLAGVSAAFVLEGKNLSAQVKSTILDLSLTFENHIDNTGPCLYGGFCSGVVQKALKPKQAHALAKKIAINISLT